MGWYGASVKLMKHFYSLVALLSTVSLVACGDEHDHEGEPSGGESGMSGSSGRPGSPGTAGSSGRGGSGGGFGSDPEGGSAQGGANDAIGGASGEGNVRGGMGGASDARGGAGGDGGATDAGGASDGGDGGQGGAAPGVEHWLAYQLEVQGDYTHPLFIASVPPMAQPIKVAADVGTWQWTPDGTKLIYSTAASYEGPSNAVYSVEVSPSGLGTPELMHEPLESNTYVSFSLSPNGETLALRVQVPEGELYRSNWYVRSVDGPSDWLLVSQGMVGEAFFETERFAWSPDGTHAAIVQDEDGEYDSLVIADAAGQVTQASFMDLNLVQWSADGSRLIAEGLYFAPDQRVLYAIDADAAFSAIEISDPTVHTAFDLRSLAVSSDGATVAFEASVTGEYDLFIKEVDSTEPAVKVDTQNAQEVVWNASHERFLYQSYASISPPGPHLFMVPRQGGEPTRVNPEGTIAQCNVAPCLWAAGNALVLATYDNDYTTNQVYDIDLSVSSPVARALTDFASDTLIDSVTLDSTLTRVLVFATDSSGERGMYEVDRNAASPSARWLLGFDAGVDPFPATAPWSSDATLIALTADHDRDPDGIRDLFVARIEGDVTTLSEPVVANDGSFVVISTGWQP